MVGREWSRVGKASFARGAPFIGVSLYLILLVSTRAVRDIVFPSSLAWDQAKMLHSRLARACFSCDNVFLHEVLSPGGLPVLNRRDDGGLRDRCRDTRASLIRTRRKPRSALEWHSRPRTSLTRPHSLLKCSFHVLAFHAFVAFIKALRDITSKPEMLSTNHGKA